MGLVLTGQRGAHGAHIEMELHNHEGTFIFFFLMFSLALPSHNGERCTEYRIPPLPN